MVTCDILEGVRPLSGRVTSGRVLARPERSKERPGQTIPQIFGSAKRVFDWGVFYDLNKITLTGSVVGD